MTGENKTDPTIVDFTRVAAVLGVDRSTLPPDRPKALVPRVALLSGDFDDEEYEKLAQFLANRFPQTNGAQNRRAWDGLIWLHRSSRPQTHIPERYGSVDSVRKRVERWAVKGVFDAILDALPVLGLTNSRCEELRLIAEKEAKRGRHIRALRASAERMANQPRGKRRG